MTMIGGVTALLMQMLQKTGIAACARVTMKAVAAALEIPLRGGPIMAEGDLDFKGTLCVDREVPIGFCDIPLTFSLDADASEEQLATLKKLTERYCVVYQTIKNVPAVEVGVRTS